ESDDAPHCLFKLVSSKSSGSAKRSAPTPIRASDTAAPPPAPPHPPIATVAFLRAACLSMRPVFRATSTSYWIVTSDVPGLRLPCLSAWGDDLLRSQYRTRTQRSGTRTRFCSSCARTGPKSSRLLARRDPVELERFDPDGVAIDHFPRKAGLVEGAQESRFV